MAITKRTRKQIESHIKQCANTIQKNGLDIGRDLIEIKDEQLWADEYDSFDKYLKAEAFNLIGKEYRQAQRLITCVKVEAKIPKLLSPVTTSLKPKHMDELARLAPDATGGRHNQKDYDKLRKADVGRVLKNAELIAEGNPVSVRDIRKAVDDELNIDRAAEAKKSRAEIKQMRDEHNELANYIRRLTAQLNSAVSMFEKVPGDGWEVLENEHPLLAKTLAEACDELASLLRS